MLYGNHLSICPILKYRIIYEMISCVVTVTAPSFLNINHCCRCRHFANYFVVKRVNHTKHPLLPLQ